MALGGGSSSKSGSGETVNQSVRIEKELFVRLKLHSAMTRQSQQEILHTALVEFLDKHESKTRKGKS